MGRRKYKSRLDASSWGLLAFSMLVCIGPLFFEFNIAPIIIGVGLLALFYVLFLGTYYIIDGDKLVVYSFFIPTAYPINKIKSIKPAKCILSVPATSLTHRLAISFTDRKVLKRSMPLIISPVRPEKFIAQLRAINPNIVAC